VSELAGRVALVTGASGGIGSAAAERLVAAGAHIALHYAQNASAAEDLRKRLGGDAVAVGADLSDPAAPAELVDAVERELGPVEILVANAGVAERRTWEDADLAAWDTAFAVNLRASFFLAQRVIPRMRDRRWGRILFTSSVAAFMGGIVGPHYAATKSGLHGLVHFLAARLAPDGITVNAVAPALVEGTGMLPGDPGELAQRVPVGRLGRPAEMADVMLAMLENGYLTSQIVGVDGGIYPR
jgi:3-oxoacyl-[acyl-carrier protein] reductase